MEEVENGEIVLNGYFGDVWHALQRQLGFTYSLTPSVEYGSQHDNGTWNGMVRKVVDHEVDFGVADVIVTRDRVDAVDFTIPVATIE